MKLKKTKLIELAMGAANELLEDAFNKVIMNIDDENTRAETRRSITLKFDFKPQSNRETTEYSISCVPKLAPVRSVSGHIFTGIQDGEPVAFENDPDQKSFDFDHAAAGGEESVSNV